MFLVIIDHFLDFYPRLNVFFNVFFRSFSAVLTAFFISFFFGRRFISWLCRLKYIQVVRDYGPKSHLLKQNTPTMGGLIIFFSIFLSALIWADLFNVYIWIVFFVLFSYCIIGYVDDYFKISRKNSVGLSVFWKFFGLFIVALLISTTMFIFIKKNISTQLVIPCFKDIVLDLGPWYILLSCFVIVGTGNAVNLSDGLDGLIIMPIVFIVSGLICISCIVSDPVLAFDFNLPYLMLAKELVIVCSSIIGSCLGFLWFNSYPAQVFMGDIGSLGLGGSIGVIVVLLRQEFLLLIMGGVFVIEALSVIFQVLCFKIFNKRIFLMAPLHHHFELKGYLESHIVIRFWIISFLLVLAGLVVLKLHNVF